jgi:hypothetical protein
MRAFSPSLAPSPPPFLQESRGLRHSALSTQPPSSGHQTQLDPSYIAGSERQEAQEEARAVQLPPARAPREDGGEGYRA